jgi:uncharacterized phiE125 gp8 family phage protein
VAVDLARAKAHLRVDFDEEDALIGAYLSAAIGAVEKASQRILTERELVFRADTLGGDARGLSLPHGPVVSVEGIDIIGSDGVAETLTVAGGDFRVVAGDPYILLPPLDGSWPGTADQPGAVSVRYTAGYGGSAGDAPGELDAAVLLMVGHLYLNREAARASASEEIPMGVQTLCWPFRRMLLG